MVGEEMSSACKMFIKHFTLKVNFFKLLWVSAWLPITDFMLLIIMERKFMVFIFPE